jgi:hypothetical protein
VTTARRRIEVALLVLSAIGLVVVGYCTLGLNFWFPQVDPRRHGIGTQQGIGFGSLWIYLMLISTLTIVLVGGLPVGRLWSSRGSLRGAVAQGLGGAVVACWSLVIAELTAGFYFTATDDACTYPGCWPVNEEKWAFVVPGVLTGIVMIVMALLVTKIPWSVRTFTPAVVWVAGLLLYYWIWTTYLLPIFEGPPRW